MKTCKDCHKKKDASEFYGIQNDCKVCYKAKVKTQKERLGVERICFICNEHFKALQTEINRGGGITCSRACYYKRNSIIQSQRNEGMKMTYGSVHQWVKRLRGKPSYCEICKTSDEGKLYDWSNISGEYRRDLSDWQRLCRKCHINHDVEHQGKSDKWRASMNKRKSNQEGTWDQIHH